MLKILVCRWQVIKGQIFAQFYPIISEILRNNIRDLPAGLLKELCNDVQIEAKLQPLTGESLEYRTAITGNEARLDVRARGFWKDGQQ